MIDIAAKREANKRRLLGQDADNTKPIPYTQIDATNAEVCWDIISLVTRKEQIEKKGRGGSSYMAEGKELAFPDLIAEEVVGEKATTSKTAKKKKITRTNIDTMDYMYSVRNKFNGFAVDDVEEDYIEYFTSTVEVLDAYAIQVVADMILDDAEFLNRINKVRGC